MTIVDFQCSEERGTSQNRFLIDANADLSTNPFDVFRSFRRWSEDTADTAKDRVRSKTGFDGF